MSFSVDLEAIGLRIETLRGKLSQVDFAAKLGVDRKTVGTWERGERLPDTRALLVLWGEFDADPAWVLTGGGFAPTTTADQRELLALFEAAPLAGKMAAVGALQGAIGSRSISAPPVTKRVNVTAHGGQAAGRKIVNMNAGDVTQTNLTPGGVQVGNVGGNVKVRR